jgi:hypothetical protein
LFGSVESPEPDPPPGGFEVVDEPPQPAEASANATEAARITPRTSAKFRSLKLISVLTIGFREFNKIGSGEKIREAFGELDASLGWAQCCISSLDAQQNRYRPCRILRQEVVCRGMAVDQAEVPALR